MKIYIDMLAEMENVAVVQLIQFGVLLFFGVLVVAMVSARRKLPRTKWEPLFDLALCLTLLIYAIGCKIFFST